MNSQENFIAMESASYTYIYMFFVNNYIKMIRTRYFAVIFANLRLLEGYNIENFVDIYNTNVLFHLLCTAKCCNDIINYPHNSSLCSSLYA